MSLEAHGSLAPLHGPGFSKPENNSLQVTSEVADGMSRKKMLYSVITKPKIQNYSTLRNTNAFPMNV